MRSSYNEDDVVILLKDITGMIDAKSTKERESLIQKGKHYSEMLPIEYSPSAKYMEAYKEALKINSDITAKSIGVLSDKIIDKKGSDVVLVSLARAGSPVGILIKRYIKWKYDINVTHYSISIIRDRGIDENALKYILDRHDAKDILFVDGWIGKGAILRELKKNLEKYPDISTELAVVADPANISELCGTHEDILIPSSCLNSTVSGLISRTVLRNDIIGSQDFHGAVYYEELEEFDLTYEFINSIQSKFELNNSNDNYILERVGLDEVNEIADRFNIKDVNLIKPGIGETTRVLLRRVPWKILISEKYKNHNTLDHIKKLAEEKNVPVEFYPLVNYKACGIIKNLADA